MKILAITPNTGAIAELRIINPLRALHRKNKISGYKIVDYSLSQLIGDNDYYDALLIQRAAPNYIFNSLNKRKIPYLLDIDDNLLANASYRGLKAELDLLEGLIGCSALITPNKRLISLLEKYSELSLYKKTIVVPNALPYPINIEIKNNQPDKILWIQSDISALTESHDLIINAVSDFSKKYHLPIVLIGKSVLNGITLPNQIIMGEIDFSSNLQLLEFTTTSIGIAPLETSSDEETLDFIAGKSDLKILLFDGYGHPGIYSHSPPYSDTSINKDCKLISNTYASWIEALEYQYNYGWRDIGNRTREIQMERHIDKIAIDCWFPALNTNLLQQPMQGKAIYEIISSSLIFDAPLVYSHNFLARIGINKQWMQFVYNKLKN